jgi:hypothetical protein
LCLIASPFFTKDYIKIELIILLIIC